MVTAIEEFEKLYPENCRVNSNGDLVGNWYIDLSSLRRLQRKIQSGVRYERDAPPLEDIEVVVRAIKDELRYWR